MPMNLFAETRARLINNIRTRIPEYDMVVTGNRLVMTPKESEYNETTTTTAEWVDPHVKMDKKTNRYRKVAGYWRDVQRPVRESSITGEATFDQLPPEKQIKKVFENR